MREKSFRIYWMTLDRTMYYAELFADQWQEVRQNKLLGSLAMVLALFHGAVVGAIIWIRSL